MREKIISFMNFIIYIAFVLIIAALIPKALSYLLQTPYPIATITSSSMWPTLKRGDMVTVKHVEPEKLREGMIVVYKDSESKGFVIHRIVEIEGDEIVTKGDANEIEDEPVPSSDIIGSVLTVGNRLLKIPYIGYITFLARGQAFN